MPMPTRDLEYEFQAQLNLPRRSATECVGLLQSPEGVSVKIAIWQVKVGVIEQVKELGTELQEAALTSQSNVPENRKIHIFEVRAD